MGGHILFRIHQDIYFYLHLSDFFSREVSNKIILFGSGHISFTSLEETVCWHHINDGVLMLMS